MLPRDHFQRPPLADLTQRFELTWYGYAVATARDFDQVTEQLEKLGCLAPSAAATQKYCSAPVLFCCCWSSPACWFHLRRKTPHLFPPATPPVRTEATQLICCCTSS